jgi:hypothetical protein
LLLIFTNPSGRSAAALLGRWFKETNVGVALKEAARAHRAFDEVFRERQGGHTLEAKAFALGLDAHGRDLAAVRAARRPDFTKKF